MSILTAISDFFAHLPVWLTAATSVVSAASAVTALTPSPKDDRVLSKVRQVLETLALNVGNAKPR
jgi:hypothetical protein